LRIAHFSWEYPPIIYGGLGTFATEITKKQSELGNDITVFSLNVRNNHETNEKWNGIEVYRPKTLDLTSTFYLFADQGLKAWGDNFKFFADVISYNTMSASQLVNMLVRKEGKKFDIIDAHDWLGIIGGMIVKKELNIPLTFHVHSTEVGRTVSYAMKDELEKLGFPTHKIRVCWNGIDPSKYDPKNVTEEQKQQLRHNYGIADNENMIFFIGRLVTVKGVDNLIRAMPYVLQDFPNSKLVILGIGDMEWLLKEMAQNLGVADKIVYRYEFISETERIIHYEAADCVVLPSIYEPFGIVCTESMSMGKPPVVGATGTNGFKEQIIPDGDNQCGVHINPHDPEDIAWGIKHILQDKKTALWMGKNARKRVLDTFTWEKITKKTLEIYKEFL
jgi:glycosyltransferase involved in cell wall biosynthesis